MVSYVNIDFLSLKESINWFKNGFYTYEGSLTTPPCTEGVRWLIAKDRHLVYPAQFETCHQVQRATNSIDKILIPHLDYDTIL